MFGILNLFKPSGPTSRDCVNSIQRLIRPIKVGHAGTLDPIAEGVLLVAVGQAVRLVDWLHLLPKSYRGTFELGKTSPSADTESEVATLADAKIPDLHQLEAVLADFVGSIAQVPPIYSAVRVDGKRAYARARAGDAIEMPVRQVMIYRLAIAEYAYPRLVLEIECGTGTYVRSLGRDLARRLGSDAIMTELHRSSIGCLSSRESVELEPLDSREAIEQQLINPVRCLTMFPQIMLETVDIHRLHQGKLIELAGFENIERIGHSETVIAIDHRGSLRSILHRFDQHLWRPHRNFLEE